MRKARHIAAAALLTLSFGIGNGPQMLPPASATVTITQTVTF